MSEFKVEVGRVLKVEKHPNADTLSIGEIHGYPVIFRTGDYSEGQLAVHVPVDSIVPDSPEWAFLGGARRIRAKRLRGVFSTGLLAPVRLGWEEGKNVQDLLGITKWEPEVHGERLNGAGPSDNAEDTGILPVYTDIEGYRRHKDVLVEGEEVVITEKVHGTNARYVWSSTSRTEGDPTPGALIIGSHKRIKKVPEDPSMGSIWVRVAHEYRLAQRLRAHPDVAIYGEIYGQGVQDLTYGVPGGSPKLLIFDALDLTTMKYLDYDQFLRLVLIDLGLDHTPILYRGPWKKDLLAMSEGKTTIGGVTHVREGFVVKPVIERRAHMGRVVLKMVGEGYLLRKGG